MHSIRHLGQVFEVRLGVLILSILLLHLHEPLHFLVDNFHHLLWHRLPFHVIQQLFDLLLLIIRTRAEMLLEVLIYFFQFLLGFGLVLSEVVLLF